MTRMIDGFADKDYNDRLKEFGLTTLETRRKRDDLIEAVKIIKGFEDVNSELFVPFAITTAHIRGHKLNFVKKGVKLNVRKKNFFSQRVVNDWNILPETVINSSSINMFKNRLDCHLMFSRGYRLIQLLFSLKNTVSV